jgi:hypothetical protein
MPTYTDFDGTLLDAAQAAAVAHALADIGDDDTVTYCRDGAPLMRPSRDTIQRFVAFASVGLAYELLAPFWARGRRSDEQIEYVPVLVDGQAVLELPDEGRSGVLHLMRFHRGDVPDRWLGVYLHCGHLTIREVASLSGAEINERIEAGY